jgi:poly(3-hydroxybutyrate) depolymerase
VAISYLVILPGPSNNLYQENRELFEYDQDSPLDIQIVAEKEGLGISHQVDMTYESPAGGRVPATIFVPKGEGPFPAILMLHGMPGCRQHMFAMAHQYVRTGAVVIAIDAPHARTSSDERPTLYYSEKDREDQIQLILDLRRAIDLLTERSDVDSNRLAYIGLSYGGAMGGLLAGVEDRIQAYVFVVGDGGLVHHFSGPGDLFGIYSTEKEKKERQAWLNSMWPIEPIHYVGHAEPAALLYQSARKDEAISLHNSLRYHWAGSNPKEVIWYDSGHWPLPVGYLRDQADWLAQYIGIDSEILH